MKAMQQRRHGYGRVLLFSTLLVLGWDQLGAAESGDVVVVVYNSAVPESKGVAEHYAAKRGVPAGQIFGFDLPTVETISRGDFRDRLQKPLFKRLVDAKLFTPNPKPFSTNSDYRSLVQARVRYAVLCYGVPLKIIKDAELVEEGIEKLRPELQRNEAAVDSELCWLPISAQKLMLAGPLPNPFYRATNMNVLTPTNGILLVSRLDGPSPAIARGLVEKALEAETNGLWGRAYFDARGITNGSYQQGDEWIRGAAQIAKRMGFETVLDDNEPSFPAGFPLSHVAIYAGWYDWHVSGPFKASKIEFMPGAFAYHLHSFSAATLRSADQNWAGPLLARGAAMTMGSVDEPYLTGTPDIATFIARLIIQGASFGEAAYASQTAVSWQTTVVGDPLYRPFADKPEIQHRNLETRQSPLIQWSHLKVVNLNQVTELPAEELIDYLNGIEVTAKSAVLKEKLADLYLSKKKPSDAMYTYSAALKLDPSPQQKIRLMLTLGDLQILYGRTQEAYETFRQFVREAPEFPKLVEVYKKLADLAEQLEKKEEAEKYRKEIKRLAPAP